MSDISMETLKELAILFGEDAVRTKLNERLAAVKEEGAGILSVILTMQETEENSRSPHMPSLEQDPTYGDGCFECLMKFHMNKANDVKNLADKIQARLNTGKLFDD